MIVGMITHMPWRGSNLDLDITTMRWGGKLVGCTSPPPLLCWGVNLRKHHAPRDLDTKNLTFQLGKVCRGTLDINILSSAKMVRILHPPNRPSSATQKVDKKLLFKVNLFNKIALFFGYKL